MSLQSIGSGRIESSFSDMSKSSGGGGGGGFGSDFRFGFLYLNTQFGCLDRGEHIRLFLLPLPAIFMVYYFIPSCSIICLCSMATITDNMLLLSCFFHINNLVLLPFQIVIHVFHLMIFQNFVLFLN